LKDRLNILLYPLIELLCLAGMSFYAINKSAWYFVFIFLAAFALNFALHISFHYLVHFPAKNKVLNRFLEIIVSLLSGIPFNYYRMNHWNHHRYDNSIEDFTTTWQKVNGIYKPKNIFKYSLLWFRSSDFGVREQQTKAQNDGYFTGVHKKRQQIETLILLALHICLFILDWKIAVGYLSVIYIGWVLIALHNYGQHIPDDYGRSKAISYYNSIYNLLSMNNGFHEEHHHEPQKPYWKLTQGEGKASGQLPHLLQGFFIKKSTSFTMEKNK
jgi:fatty acid desaturase